MKNKSCEFGTFNGLTYRVCYGLTQERKMDYSKELYEFSENYKCDYCSSRFKYTRGTLNQLTITTDSKNKFQEIAELINKYNCNSKTSKKNKYMRV